MTQGMVAGFAAGSAAAFAQSAASHHPTGDSAANDAIHELDALADELARNDQCTELLAVLERILRIDPHRLVALFNRAVALQRLGLDAQALDAHTQTLEHDPTHTPSRMARAALYNNQGHSQKALDDLNVALQTSPDDQAARHARAVVLANQEQYELALQDYALLVPMAAPQSEAASSQSSAMHPDAALRAGFCHLMLGHYAQGWPLYEWRWQVDPQLVQTQRIHQYPCAPLRDIPAEQRKGLSVFVWLEQGYGDVFQFCRYAQALAQQGATVLFQSDKSLYPLLHQSLASSGVVILQEGVPTAPFHSHCPLMSLPLAMGTDSLRDIPAPIPYLKAHQGQAAVWEQRLLAQSRHAKTPPLRVGLVWRGKIKTQEQSRRALPFAQVQQLMQALRGASIQWVSLQKGLSPEEQRALSNDGTLIDWTDDLHDWADTAALIDRLDQVITVDTAIAHLAAAMGKPTWVLLRFNPDWRWLTHRDDSPWYPTARLFRQPALGDWDSVMRHVRQALVEYNLDKNR